MKCKLLASYFFVYLQQNKRLGRQFEKLLLWMWNNKSVTSPSVWLSLNADLIVKTIKLKRTNDCRTKGVVRALPTEISESEERIKHPSLKDTHTHAQTRSFSVSPLGGW